MQSVEHRQQEVLVELDVSLETSPGLALAPPTACSATVRRRSSPAPLRWVAGRGTSGAFGDFRLAPRVDGVGFLRAPSLEFLLVHHSEVKPGGADARFRRARMIPPLWASLEAAGVRRRLVIS